MQSVQQERLVASDIYVTSECAVGRAADELSHQHTQIKDASLLPPNRNELSLIHISAAGCGIVHGLMPLRRQVQDCEAPISQTDFIGFPRRVTQNDRAAVVRPTMREGSGGALQHLGRNTRMMRNDAKDSAHSLSCTMIA